MYQESLAKAADAEADLNEAGLQYTIEQESDYNDSVPAGEVVTPGAGTCSSRKFCYRDGSEVLDHRILLRQAAHPPQAAARQRVKV